MENLHLIEYLRKIQTEWELTPEEFSKVSHISEYGWQLYFNLGADQIEMLPSLPPGLDVAMPLVSVYKNLNLMFKTPEEQNEWLVTPNELFEKNKPIEVMAMSPKHLSWVSYTLESKANEKRF